MNQTPPTDPKPISPASLGMTLLLDAKVEREVLMGRGGRGAHAALSCWSPQLMVYMILKPAGFALMDTLPCSKRGCFWLRFDSVVLAIHLYMQCIMLMYVAYILSTDVHGGLDALVNQDTIRRKDSLVFMHDSPMFMLDSPTCSTSPWIKGSHIPI
jgi:hypothetical protein